MLLPQALEIWNPVEAYPSFLHGAWAVQAGAGSLLVFCDGHFQNGLCLVLAFGPVEEVHVYEEFAHEWPDSLAATRPGTTPFLRVVNSEWAASSTQQKLFGVPLHHFCVISGDSCVEVLCKSEPSVRWAEASEIDSLFDTCNRLGVA